MVSWLNSLVGVKVNQYQTKVLQHVRKDSLEWLQNMRVLYFCRYADESILSARNFKSASNEPLNRIMSLFRAMPQSFELWSLVDRGANSGFGFYKGIKKEKLFYPPCLGGKFFSVFNSLLIALRMIIERDHFDAFMIYNFNVNNIFPALTAKILGKKLIVDFEDDYELRDGFPGAKITFRILKHMVDGVIAVNPYMARHFKNIPVSVIESFADLSYMQCLLEPQKGIIQLLYSGSLDEIRGGDLIVPLSKELTRSGIEHIISVTGSGHFKEQILSSGVKSIDFLGFVSQEELSNILERSHVGLVLQKPDHPFSLGSFPSKIEFYAKQMKPILVIENQ